jgi:hypothetical protein
MYRSTQGQTCGRERRTTVGPRGHATRNGMFRARRWEMPCCYRFHSRNCGRMRPDCGRAVGRGVGAARTRLPSPSTLPPEANAASRAGAAAPPVAAMTAPANEATVAASEVASVRTCCRSSLKPISTRGSCLMSQPTAPAQEAAISSCTRKLMRARSIPAAQLAYSSLEFNFALQRADDLSQLAHYRHPLNLLSCLEGLGSCRAPRPSLTSSHRRSVE